MTHVQVIVALTVRLVGLYNLVSIEPVAQSASDVRIGRSFEVFSELNDSFGWDLADVLILFFEHPLGNLEPLGFFQDVLSPPTCRWVGKCLGLECIMLVFRRRRTG